MARRARPRVCHGAGLLASCLRDSFLNGRTVTGLDNLNAHGRHWLGSVASNRIHATARARPCDRLLDERLTPFSGLNAYQVARSIVRTVGAEVPVRFKKSDYSAPARRVGTRVSVDAGNNIIVIGAKDLIVALVARQCASGILQRGKT